MYVITSCRLIDIKVPNNYRFKFEIRAKNTTTVTKYIFIFLYRYKHDILHSYKEK